ncbi:uncharacterized protein LOC124973045 [Sciurus carolinensis]|uniref:uncharacterized protein LOC124973045 n=1 Tax=Sciurus carolinensis TaxID=30640 RepID=UPI001FB27D7E|nr:uncharacterized protein LOC124973045 [Sciurus carolinensis]XP_047393206.1 uncharacterized protein LOC124973045 [Sciurus carolinensis]
MEEGNKLTGQNDGSLKELKDLSHTLTSSCGNIEPPLMGPVSEQSVEAYVNTLTDMYSKLDQDSSHIAKLSWKVSKQRRTGLWCRQALEITSSSDNWEWPSIAFRMHIPWKTMGIFKRWRAPTSQTSAPSSSCKGLCGKSLWATSRRGPSSCSTTSWSTTSGNPGLKLGLERDAYIMIAEKGEKLHHLMMSKNVNLFKDRPQAEHHAQVLPGQGLSLEWEEPRAVPEVREEVALPGHSANQSREGGMGHAGGHLGDLVRTGQCHLLL